MRFLKISALFLFLITLSNSCVYSQAENDEVQEIKVLFDKLFYAQDDSVKSYVNQKIINVLGSYVEQDHKFLDDFKEIKNLSVLKSDDNDIYLFTWSLQYSDNLPKYFGFVKYYNINRGEYYVDELKDNQEIVTSSIENKIYPENWYGALYYKIISIKYEGERHYVLLGWDSNDDFTNKKLIDVLYIEDDEFPVFGKKIIEYEGRLVSRLVFEYAERVAMSLKYDKKTKQIIWEHLSPSKPELKGHYKYYGPDLTFDALYFNNGIWKYNPDIELNK